MYLIRRASPFALALVFSLAAWSDQTGTAVLKPHTCLNLETGALSCSGGDIFWDGTALTVQGTAGIHNLGKYGSRVFRAIHARNAAAATYDSEPIPASAMVAGEIFGVRTSLGHYAKVIVTGAGQGSIALEYTTYVSAKSPAAASGPVITELQNNYSYILPGLPNYGIAPGSIFVIIGTGLSSSTPPVLQSSAAPGLPTTLNQTSVSVTVNGVTTTPPLYYTSASQLAAVLPSNTPAGTGTITVTYNGQPSAAAPIRVVADAPGLDTLYGTGNGAGVATDNNGNVFGLTNSAMPNQTVILWGSGIAADPSNDDRIYPQKQNDLTGSIHTQVFIGGIGASVGYSGRSQYPGLDQYNVVIPPNVTPGCFVSVVIQVGTIVSNAVTLPVQPGGGVCTDPATGLTGAQIAALANKSGGNVNALLLGILQNQTKNNVAAAALPVALSSSYFGSGYEYVSEGSCTTVPPQQGGFSALGQPLDTGAIQVTTPSGQVTLQGAEAPLSGATGTYTFSSSGGNSIGKFTATVTPKTTVTLSNAAALTTITRSAGATVTWTGGNGTVQVEGDLGGPFGTMRFYCYAPSSAGQLVIPPSILLAMPTGGGNLTVTDGQISQTLSATGLDVGFAANIVTVQKVDTVFK